MKFEERRKAIQAIRDFRPGMEVEDNEIPIEVMAVAFLAFIGAVVVILGVGLFMIWITV
jgi:hypothetical protein